MFHVRGVGELEPALHREAVGRQAVNQVARVVRAVRERSGGGDRLGAQRFSAPVLADRCDDARRGECAAARSEVGDVGDYPLRPVLHDQGLCLPFAHCRDAK